MAIIAKVETDSGESRELYIALIGFEGLTKHGESSAVFRGFLSKEAFDAGKSFVWEKLISFKTDMAEKPGPIAFEALKNADFAPDEKLEYKQLADRLDELNAEIEKLEEDARSDPRFVEGEKNAIDLDQKSEVEAGEARLAQLLNVITEAEELSANLNAGKAA